MSPQHPFLAYLADAETELATAPSRTALDAREMYARGVLKGYWLGGAICDIEHRAAQNALRAAYQERFKQLAPEHVHV